MSSSGDLLSLRPSLFALYLIFALSSPLSSRTKSAWKSGRILHVRPIFVNSSNNCFNIIGKVREYVV